MQHCLNHQPESHLQHATLALTATGCAGEGEVVAPENEPSPTVNYYNFTEHDTVVDSDTLYD